MMTLEDILIWEKMTDGPATKARRRSAHYVKVCAYMETNCSADSCAGNHMVEICRARSEGAETLARDMQINGPGWKRQSRNRLRKS